MAFKRILCAVDFSPDSLRAFHLAAELAKRDGTVLHVVHVIEAEPVLAQATIEIMAEANRAMEALLASTDGKLSGVEVTSEITPGRAFEEVPARVRAWRPDLVALGAKGVTSLEDTVTGGTAENVIKEASCSVLIAREQPRRSVA